MKEINLQKELVLKCVNGSRSAQFQLYNMYSKGMYNICMRLMHNEFDAEDALQEAFVSIYKRLDTYKFDATLGAWIKRIVINSCIDHLRKKKIAFAQLESEMENVPEQENSHVDHTYDVQRIKNALTQLPDGYRVIFSLYAIEGYDHEEIAEILSITESTSKSQYSRAKAKLRHLLNNYKSLNIN